MMTSKKWRKDELMSFSATNEDGGGWVVEERRYSYAVLYKETKSAFSTHLEMQVRIETLLAEHKEEEETE